ncbi:hypothetical protein YC2023_100828 [Brassica napus]
MTQLADTEKYIAQTFKKKLCNMTQEEAHESRTEETVDDVHSECATCNVTVTHLARQCRIQWIHVIISITVGSTEYNVSINCVDGLSLSDTSYK